MSRRLPTCAGCGRSLANAKERITHELTAVRGKPCIGACWDCHLPTIVGPNRIAIAPVLRELYALDPSRVTLLGRVTIEEACESAAALDAKRGL